MWSGNSKLSSTGRAALLEAMIYYDENEIGFKKLTRRLEDRIRFILFDPSTNKPMRGLQISNIESRTKEKLSYREKVARKLEEYEKAKRKFPYKKNIDDCIGIRIIHYKKSESEKIRSLLLSAGLEEMRIQKIQSPADRFGYQATHLTIKVPKYWKKSEGIKLRGDILAEIQIVTLSQHIWANLSHKVNYKLKTLNADDERALFKMAALCELVDDLYDDLANKGGQKNGN